MNHSAGIYRIILLILIISNFNFSSYSQQTYLKGIVTDYKTKQAVPFATVFQLTDRYGVISNENGSFRIPYNSSDSEIKIEISAIGYKPYKRQLTDIDPEKHYKFYLTPKNYSIDEVVIKGKKARKKNTQKIVHEAIKRIPENYPNYPFMLKGYYRDYLKTDSKYVNLYEAFVELEDSGFHTNDMESTKLNLVYGAFNKSFMIDSTKIIDYGDHKNKTIPHGKTDYMGGNELFFLFLHNPIRNYKHKSFDFIQYLQYGFLNHHSFKMITADTINSVPYYIISIQYINPDMAKQFDTGSVTKVSTSNFKRAKYRAKGQIVINRNNYQIMQLNYMVYLYNKNKTEKLWECNLEYGKRNEEMFLKYLSFNNLIEIPDYTDEHYFYLKNINIDKEYNLMRMYFNNAIDTMSFKLNDIHVKYNNEPLEIIKINVRDTFIKVKIKDFGEIFKSFKHEDSNKLKIRIKNIKDSKGNKINDVKSMKAYQYREFFTEDVKKDYESIIKEECMDKYKSMIYGKGRSEEMPKGSFFNSPLIYK